MFYFKKFQLKVHVYSEVLYPVVRKDLENIVSSWGVVQLGGPELTYVVGFPQRLRLVSLFILFSEGSPEVERKQWKVAMFALGD